MILSAPNEKQDKENLGQKQLSDNTEVDLGATNDHGYPWVLQACYLWASYRIRCKHPPGGGVTPILDLTGCAAQQCALLR